MSFYFNGVQGTSLQVANNASFRFGTGDFTIEFFVKADLLPDTPRIVTFGKYPSSTFSFNLRRPSSGYEIEINGTFLIIKTDGTYNWIGVWRHVALARSSGVLRLFVDGTLLETLSCPDNFTDSINPLYIGGELNSDYPSLTTFYGSLTNFHWVTGTALYTSNFPKPLMELSPVANTKLLLLARSAGTMTSDSGPLNQTVSNTNVVWSSNTPVINTLASPAIENPPLADSQSITFWWGFTDLTNVSSVYIQCEGPNGGSNYVPVSYRQKTFINLNNSSTYTGKIQAVAANGVSTAIVSYIPVKPGVAPSAPQNVVMSKSGSSVVVSWDPPASDGGSDVIWYILQSLDETYGFSIEPWKRTFTSPAIGSGTYSFVLYAENYAGWGTPSAFTVLSFP